MLSHLPHSALCPTPEPGAHPSHDGFVHLCAGYFIQDTVRDSIESITEIQKDSISWLPLVSSMDNFVVKGNCQGGLCPHEPVLAVTSDYIVLHMSFSNSQNNHLHNFTRHGGWTGRPVVTRVSICQLPVDSPDSQDCWKVMERDLVMKSASSLSTLAWIPSHYLLFSTTISRCVLIACMSVISFSVEFFKCIARYSTSLRVTLKEVWPTFI